MIATGSLPAQVSRALRRQELGETSDFSSTPVSPLRGTLTRSEQRFMRTGRPSETRSAHGVASTITTGGRLTEGFPTNTRQWGARPFAAGLIRTAVLLLPMLASAGFVYVAAGLVPPPAGSLTLYLGWWAALSVIATAVLVAVGRLCRRLLPLAALLRLSLVFPDGAPSRFRTAMQSGTVASLEERLAEAKRSAEVTPAEAARRLLVLVAALDTHDSLTRGHSERVRAYAQMIGRELGLKPSELELLNWAALLHDVGKLEIPHEILAKNGRPTEDEWAILRRHPEHGEALVAPLRGWLGDWCDAVGHHHERWDGSGYPRGLAGKEISLAGRIVAVADVFDVVTSSRSYKTAAGAGAGRAEIARCAGTQFDPDVVRAFLGISLGRARIASGPLSWLAHAPVLARVPLTSAAALSTVAVAAGATAAAGLVADRADPPAGRSVDSTASPAAVAGGAVAATGRQSGATAHGAFDAAAPETHDPSPPDTAPGTPSPPSQPPTTATPDPPSAPADPPATPGPPAHDDPVVDVPTVEVPPVDVPDVDVPDVDVPGVDVPDVDVPEVPDVPDVPQVPPLPAPPPVETPSVPTAPAPAVPPLPTG